MAAEWVETQEFDEIFETNLALLTDVRDYLQGNISAERSEEDDPIAKLTATREASRLTAMLAETMSWLLLNKAMNNDELDLDKVLTESASLCEQIGASPDDVPTIVSGLPDSLHNLFEKSNHLFADVHGILAQARGAAN